MFGTAKIENSNVWKTQNRNYNVWRRAQIENSNVWKSQNRVLQSLEKPKSSTPIFGKAEIENSSV